MSLPSILHCWLSLALALCLSQAFRQTYVTHENESDKIPLYGEDNPWDKAIPTTGEPDVFSVPADIYGSSFQIPMESKVMPADAYHASVLIELQSDKKVTALVKLDTRPAFTVRNVIRSQIQDLQGDLRDAWLVYSARQHPRDPSRAIVKIPSYYHQHEHPVTWHPKTFGQLATDLTNQLRNVAWHPSNFNCQDFTKVIAQDLLGEDALFVAQSKRILGAGRERVAAAMGVISKHISKKARWTQDRAKYGRYHQTLFEEPDLEGSETYQSLRLDNWNVVALHVIWESTGPLVGALQDGAVDKAFEELKRDIGLMESAEWSRQRHEARMAQIAPPRASAAQAPPRLTPGLQRFQTAAVHAMRAPPRQAAASAAQRPPIMGVATSAAQRPAVIPARSQGIPQGFRRG